MIGSGKPRLSTAIVCCGLLAALAACASVEKRYQKGQELESQGRLEEAAQRYITVLAKEPGREDARQRLAEVGGRIVDDLTARARMHEADGRYEDAFEALSRVEGLRGRAGQVGVTLAVPDDHADFRRDMLDAAAASLFRQGEDLERAGSWAEASRRYDRLRSYPLDPERMIEVDESRARVLLRWAEADLERGAYRAAYGHAQNAMEIFGPDSETARDGRAVQRAALDAGTRTIAVLPFWIGPGAGARTPRGIENRLYDALLHEHLAEPVPFVGPIDRGEIHREMVRLRVRSGDIPDRTAATVGQALQADLVAVGWLASYAQEDGVPEEIARKAPLRRDKASSAAYTEKRYAVRLTGQVAYRILDPISRRVVDEGTVAAQVSAPFRRAYFDGDPAALDLGRDERALFDREAWRRAEEELQAGLVSKLAEKTAAGLIEKVLRLVR